MDDQDRTEYLARVKRYREKNGFVLYAYVLMSNHVHLLIETPKEPLSKIMQLINFTYTQYFNKKYGKVGHLFQGRYKALLCDRDEYLLGLVRYIHLNPVRVKMANRPEEYKWSSHHDYVKESNGLVSTERVLRLFSERISQARRLFAVFVDEEIGTGRNEEFYKAYEQQIVGDDKFVEKVEKKIERLEEPLRKPSLKEIYKAVKEVTGVSEEEITSRSRQKEVVFARGAMIAAWRASGHQLVDLQAVLKRDLSVLSKYSKVKEEDRGKRAVDRVIKLLNARLQA